VSDEYYQNLGRYPILTREEELALVKKVEAGDLEARRIMICSNLRLVMYHAKRFINQGVSFLDLVQEGNIILVDAVDRIGQPKGFDWRRGFKFSTYFHRNIYWNLSRVVERNKRHNRRYSCGFDFTCEVDQGQSESWQDVDQILKKELVRESLLTLNERERKIIDLRFGFDNKEPRTLQDIGIQLGVSKERIRQIINKALEDLGSYFLEILVP
jgi:RNA polymerase sigma factor (sigma-70 family)